jgi:hypothetical protein
MTNQSSPTILVGLKKGDKNMNCQGCGRSLAPGTVFCESCGSAAPAPPPPPQPVNTGFNQPPQGGFNQPPQGQWGATPPPQNQAGWNNNQPPNNGFQQMSGNAHQNNNAWGGHQTWNSRNALGEGIASLVMAIISFIILWWLGIAAIISGIAAIATSLQARRMQSQNGGTGGNQWLGGLITGILGVILGIISVALFWAMIW